MRPAFVVVDSPSLDDFTSFGDRHEHVLVEAFVSKLSVEALAVGVFLGKPLRQVGVFGSAERCGSLRAFLSL
jgi:hypothetical protein